MLTLRERVSLHRKLERLDRQLANLAGWSWMPLTRAMQEKLDQERRAVRQLLKDNAARRYGVEQGRGK